MKLSKDDERILTEMCFEEKSNSDIATVLGIDLKDVHAARSRLGITIPKVKAAKEKGVQTVQPVLRTMEEIDLEAEKVLKAKKTAKKKIARCDERLVELSEERQQLLRKEM